MTQLTIRNIDDVTRLKLRTRAAAKGRSLEAELRDILVRAVAEGPPSQHVGRSVRQRFERVGGVEFDIPPRSKARDVPHFE